MTADYEATTTRTPARATPGPQARLAVIRISSLATLVVLVIQFALGTAENLYGTMPGAHHPLGVFSGGALLAIHGVLGIALSLGAIAAAVRSVRARHRPAAISSVTAMLALIAATLTGFMFLGKGQDGASLAMALATGVAMICYSFNIWVLGGARQPGRP